MQAGAAVHGPTRLDLQRDAGGVDAGGAQRRASRTRPHPRSDSGVGVTRGGSRSARPVGSPGTSSRRPGRSRGASSRPVRGCSCPPARQAAARAAETAPRRRYGGRGGRGRRPGRPPPGRSTAARTAARRSGCRACRRRTPRPGSDSVNSLAVVTSVRSGRSRTRTCARSPSVRAASAAAASSSTPSSPRAELPPRWRARSARPTWTSRSPTSPPGQRRPPGRSPSSAAPKMSQPAPSSFRMRRSAMLGLALSETSTRVGP